MATYRQHISHDILDLPSQILANLIAVICFLESVWEEVSESLCQCHRAISTEAIWAVCGHVWYSYRVSCIASRFVSGDYITVRPEWVAWWIYPERVQRALCVWLLERPWCSCRTTNKAPCGWRCGALCYTDKGSVPVYVCIIVWYVYQLQVRHFTGLFLIEQSICCVWLKCSMS